MLPPIRPIDARDNHWLLERDLRELDSFRSKIRESRKTATRAFFKKVNANGLNPDTAKLFRKIETPLTRAVQKTSNNPLDSFIE